MVSEPPNPALKGSALAPPTPAPFRIRIWIATLAILVAACSNLGIGRRQPIDESQRKPQEQSWGPNYPAQAPGGRRDRIDSASLSPDLTVLTIGFVGGPGFHVADPCSTDYQPWVGPNGDELDATVVEIAHPEQPPLGFNEGCSAVGYVYQFHLTLPAPFTGTTINELAQGGTLLVGAPPSIATIAAADLPAGWSRQQSISQEPGPPPIWIQVFAAAPVEPPLEGPGRLVLYQALGISPEWTDTRALKSQERGGAPISVTLHGQKTPLWVDKSTGELLLGWDLDGNSFGLIGNSADLTQSQLVSIAEGITIPK
jgi:hypothetical protein